MKAKPGQQAAQRRARRLDDLAAAQAERRQHGVEHRAAGAAAQTVASANAQCEQRQHRRLGRANAPTGWRRVPYPTGRALWPYIRACDGPRPSAGFRPRRAAPAARARGARLASRAPSSSARSRAAWSSASTTCAGPFRWRSISAATATRSPRRWPTAQTVGWLVRADLGHGFARLARGPAVVADEEVPALRARRASTWC